MTEEIEIIMNERKNILDQYSSIRSANIRIIVGGIAAAFLVFSYVLSKGEYEALIVLPYFLLGVMFYNLLLFSGMYTLTGYLKYLEEKLHKIESAKHIRWAEMAEKHIRNQKNNYPIIALILILFVGIIGMILLNCVTISFCPFSFQPLLIIVHFSVWIIGFAVLCYSFERIRRLDRSVYDDLITSEPKPSPE